MWVMAMRAMAMRIVVMTRDVAVRIVAMRVVRMVTMRVVTVRVVTVKWLVRLIAVEFCVRAPDVVDDISSNCSNCCQNSFDGPFRN